MTSGLLESAGKPISYDDVLLNQLERIAEGISNGTATILNIHLMHYLITIDQDVEYEKDLKILNEEMGIEESDTFDMMTKRESIPKKMEIRYEYSFKKLGLIMKCLKRSGRFPSKFGLIDESEMEGNDALQIDPPDSKVESGTQ